MNLTFELINEKYVDSAVKLVLEAYYEERESIPYLPDGRDLLETLKQSMVRLFRNGTGIGAFMDGKLAGFIAAYHPKELWGRCRGAYSPLYGHGAMKENRRKIYQELYKQAAKMWVKENITSHALTLFAHDKEAIDTWFLMGFGGRCVDSIRKTEALETVKSDIIIKKIGMDEVADVAEVHRELNLYLKHPPMFMPRKEEDPIADLREWLSEDNRHLWAAYKDGKAVGHMMIQNAAETFISEHTDVMNITGAYVLDSDRHSGVAALLLDTVQRWLLQNGYSLCGVDFESFNLYGSGFWNKYFTPYTYSLTRRIDERII